MTSEMTPRQFTQGPLLEKARQIAHHEQTYHPEFHIRNRLFTQTLRGLTGYPIELVDLARHSFPPIQHGKLLNSLGGEVWMITPKSSFYVEDVRLVDWNPVSDLPTIILDSPF